MNKQFLNIQTFFDLGIETLSKNNFYTMKCINYGIRKKRILNNNLIIKYLRGNNLTLEELKIVKSILDGSVYLKQKSKYEHCRICSNDFIIEQMNIFSSKYKYWAIGYPTVPYFPSGFMIYLKERKRKKIENFQDLSVEQIKELKLVMKDIYEILNDNIFFGNLSGINLLFNQISKSELCIHGHVELMISDIDKLSLGCYLEETMPYDIVTKILNDEVNCCNGVFKFPQGLRIMFNNEEEDVLGILKEYENNIKNLVYYAKQISEEPIDLLEKRLYSNLSPAPANSVYLTYYRNNYILSSVPCVTLDTLKLADLRDNQEQVYCLKINQYAKTEDSLLMNEIVPLVRPSIKVISYSKEGENVQKLLKKVKEVLY